MSKAELARLMKRAKISRSELARRVCVTPAAVHYWLSGERKMHPVFAKVIREVIRKYKLEHDDRFRGGTL